MLSLIRRLTRFFRQPPHDYVVSIKPFPDVNVEKLKGELELAKEGAARGAQEEPASGNAAFDTIEQKIVERIEVARRDSLNIFHDNMEGYAHRLSAQGVEGFNSTIKNKLSTTKANFHALVHKGRDELYERRLRVIEAERTYNHFRREHGIVRLAQYPESRLLHVALLLAMLLGEATLNGFMLARGNEFGLVGGVTYALLIALLNVVVLGFLFGSFCLRLSHHRKRWIKATGIVGFLLAAAVAIGFNLLVAHYRDALGGSTPELADRLAIKAFLTTPFEIEETGSWVLCIFGIALCIIGAVDGLKLDDPYPGYGEKARQRDRIRTDYSDTKVDLIDDVQSERDDYIGQATKAKDEIEKRIGERSQILDGRKRHQLAYEDHIQHLEDAANALLMAYREVNGSVRKTPQPAHFGKRWQIQRDKGAEIIVSPVLDDRQIAEIARQTRAELDNAVSEINEAFTDAFAHYNRIEELTPEQVRHEQQKQDAA